MDRLNHKITLASVAGALVLLAGAAAAQGRSEQLLLGFKPGTAASARMAVAEAGGNVDLVLSRVNALAITVPAGAMAGLARRPAVEYVEADPVRTVMRATRSALKTPQSLPSDSETTPYGIPMVQADQVTYNAAGGRMVCIVDSGYNLGHEDLQSTSVSGKNLTRETDWNDDRNSHGTHVAGTVAALGGNNKGVVGVVGTGQMPLYIAKVFDAAGSARSSIIMNGVNACADAGANVISMSLGGGAPSRTEERLYNTLAANNVLVVAAAGNAGTSAISYPAGYASVMSVAAVDSAGNWADFSQFNADVEIAAPGVGVYSTVPAGSQLGAALSVGASEYTVQSMDGSPRTSATGPLADFGLGDSWKRGAMTGKVCLISRGGATFADKVKNCQRSGGVGAVIYNNEAGDLFGTLGGTATTIPSVGATQADGQAMLAMTGESATVAVFSTTDLYAAYSGTSMATPHVSAVAALVWSNYPGCTAAQVRAALTATAADLGAQGRDDQTGAGLVQALGAANRLAQPNCGGS